MGKWLTKDRIFKEFTEFGTDAREDNRMSAQAGIWNLDGRPAQHNLLTRFSDVLKGQGPDGESRYLEGSISLLYRPFHTTLESRMETQPFKSPQGFVFTLDGRLDNRDELKSQLRQIGGTHKADIAIMATAFECWGVNCFRRF